jgi:hypothetical protein
MLRALSNTAKRPPTLGARSQRHRILLLEMLETQLDVWHVVV